MYIDDFREIIVELTESMKFRDEYLGNLREIDYNLSDIFYDNKYYNSLACDNDFLINKLFGPELIDHVNWFLYEWKEGYMIEDKGIQYYINNIDDFVEATEQIYCLPMRQRGV
jgi:hypothetical protein